MPIIINILKMATANALIVIIVTDASKTQVDAQDARKETNFFLFINALILNIITFMIC